MAFLPLPHHGCAQQAQHALPAPGAGKARKSSTRWTNSPSPQGAAASARCRPAGLAHHKGHPQDRGAEQVWPQVEHRPHGQPPCTGGGRSARAAQRLSIAGKQGLCWLEGRPQGGSQSPSGKLGPAAMASAPTAATEQACSPRLSCSQPVPLGPLLLHSTCQRSAPAHLPIAPGWPAAPGWCTCRPPGAPPPPQSR